LLIGAICKLQRKEFYNFDSRKSCKIDFAEAPYNYTMKHCHTPLIKECEDPKPSYNGAAIVENLKHSRLRLEGNT